MLWAEGRINAAEHDLYCRCERANLANDFCYARVPVRHAGLHQGNIERRLMSEKIAERRDRQTEASKTASNGREDRRFVTDLRVKLAAAPVIAPIIAGRHSRIETIEKVEQAKFGAPPQKPGGS